MAVSARKYSVGMQPFDIREGNFDVPQDKMTIALPLFYQSGYLNIKHYNPIK